MLKGTKAQLKHNSGKKGTMSNRVKVGLGQSSSWVTTQTGLSCRSGAACPWQEGCLPTEMSHGCCQEWARGPQPAWRKQAVVGETSSVIKIT